ncbi:maleylpyruvate isomerase family mycothiol-dependent enzyme [Nocardioides sp. DS6]|uniref:Maleylpyruvate isomerase family mycothiol-dependent enzyme n=1 Tax=Nocardioides eburneus TaxID=3231482 RepID=A0ABV3T044_9ACTN
MPTELTLERHVAGLGEAMSAFVRYADRAGLDAAVPTCPDWTVRDLTAHQGMVHRWATSFLRGVRTSDPEAWERAGRAQTDPVAWLGAGAAELARTIRQTPDDVRAPVFLNDAPRPRAFWARRQCHETTMHAVDAQAAALGRTPDAVETSWIETEVAVDGIDELLAGFLTRPRERLRTEEESTLVVAPDDSGSWWVVSLGPRPALTSRGKGPLPDSDWLLTGTAVELYLRLWNRGPAPSLDENDWRGLAAVTWSGGGSAEPTPAGQRKVSAMPRPRS